MLPLATHCHTHYHLHPFYFVLFKFKVLVSKQHPTRGVTTYHVRWTWVQITFNTACGDKVGRIHIKLFIHALLHVTLPTHQAHPHIAALASRTQPTPARIAFSITQGHDTESDPRWVSLLARLASHTPITAGN